MPKGMTILLVAVFAFTAAAAFAAEPPAKAKAAPAAAAAAPAAEPAAPAGPKYGASVGDTVKPFVLSYEGKEFTSESLMGKPTALLFMTSACTLCRDEMRAFNEALDQFKGKANVVALCTDFDDKRIPIYKKAFNIEFPIVHDPDAKVAGSLNVLSTPVLFLLDPNNKIVSRNDGYAPGGVQDLLKLVSGAK